jgi:hypothetical protein
MKPFNLSQHLRRSPVNVLDEGVIGDGLADDTAAFQAACNLVAASPISRSLFIPGDATIRLTGPISLARPIRIFGEGTEPFVSAPLGNSRGRGSWLHFAHTGKGLVFDNGAGTVTGTSMSGVQLEMFGTFRDQPAPASGWAPTDHDYDIYLAHASAELERLMLLNATRGIGAFQGGYGRLSLRRIEGQFMKIGVRLDKQYDVVMIEHFRRWSYWADNTDVHGYTGANLDTLYLERVDNPQISNFFSIAHRAAIRIGQSADDATNPAVFPGGTVSKLKATNVDIDFGTYGLWLDNTGVNQVLADFVNFAVQSKPLAGSCGVLLEGASSRIGFTNFDVRSVEQNAIRSVNTSGSNWVEIAGRIFVDNWNTANAGFSAFDAEANNTIFLHSQPWATNGHNGNIYGGVAKPNYVAFSEDAAGQYVTVANGGNMPLPRGAGIAVLGLTNVGNEIGVYAYGGGLTTLIGASGARWVASTTTPAAGKASVAYDGAGFYRIYNNTGSSALVSMAGFRLGEGP